MPDVFVYLKPIGRRRGSVSVIVDGPPVLILEVLSDGTYDNDLDLTAGKAYSYARGGVREYLTLDPTGEFVPELGRGWRLQDGVYVPWLPAPDGRWLSQEIPVAYSVEEEMAVVSTHDGQTQLREGEVTLALGASMSNWHARKGRLRTCADAWSNRNSLLSGSVSWYLWFAVECTYADIVCCQITTTRSRFRCTTTCVRYNRCREHKPELAGPECHWEHSGS